VIGAAAKLRKGFCEYGLPALPPKGPLLENGSRARRLGPPDFAAKAAVAHCKTGLKAVFVASHATDRPDLPSPRIRKAKTYRMEERAGVVRKPETPFFLRSSMAYLIGITTASPAFWVRYSPGAT
jgi:hypothetical protein